MAHASGEGIRRTNQLAHRFTTALGAASRRQLVVRLVLAVLAITAFVGFAVSIVPGIPAHRGFDGFFDGVVVRGGGLGFWVKNGLSIYTGKHTALPEVKIVRCKKLEAKPQNDGDKVFIDLDGEQPGVLPASWEIVPAAIDLLV